MLTPTVGGHGSQRQSHQLPGTLCSWGAAAPFSCSPIQGCEMASASGSLCPHTGLALLSSTLGGEPGTNQRTWLLV